MGRSESAKIVVGLLIYFVILFTIFFVGGSVDSEYNYNAHNLTSSGGGLPNAFDGGYCGEERFMGFGTGSIEASLLPSGLQERGYITNEASCEVYEGFVWNNETSYLWGLYESGASCEGVINHTFYNVGGSQNFTTDWGDNYLQTEGFFGSSVPLSELYLIQTDQTTCELFGFAWVVEDANLELEPTTSTAVTVWGTIKNSMTFDLTLSTSTAIINDLAKLFFVVIPLIIMLFNMFIMIPFVGGD